MCRLTIYKGRPILIGDIVITPENSLLYQSRDAAYHPGVVDKCNQRNILVNGDGFGISWYGEDVSKGSCCFKFVTPAWSDTNLRNIGRHISSKLIFAHVRAAASGHNPFEPMIVSNENCHPFTYKEYTFMHNGGIPSFQLIKLKILKLLSPETFANIKGTTDTEHIFAIYLNCLPPVECGQLHTVHEMVDAMNQTVSIILQLCAESGIKDHCSLNLCVTNGVHIIATRFRTGPKAPPSLYYNIGCNFVCKNGHFYAEDDTTAAEIVISSAPLSKVCCPQNQLHEPEQDLSFCEDNGEAASGPGSPTGRVSLGGAAKSGGIRPSTSATSLRALLASQQAQQTQQTQQVLCSDDPHGADSGSDSDIGSWILIPKNHMLVCKGSLQNPERLEAFYLEPVTVATSTEPLSYPLTPCRRRSSSDASLPPVWTGVPVSAVGLSGAGAGAGAAPPAVAHRKRDASEAALNSDGSDGERSGSTSVSACSSTAGDGTGLLVRCDSEGSAKHSSPRPPCSGVVFSPKCTQKPKIMKFPCKLDG